MQLIAVGDVVLNLDRITVLDMDRPPTGGIVLRVRGESSQPIIELVIAPQTFAALMNLVPQNMRLSGGDDVNI